MSREILDCLKRERDICVKNVIHSQNTAFMFTPALNLGKTISSVLGIKERVVVGYFYCILSDTWYPNIPSGSNFFAIYFARANNTVRTQAKLREEGMETKSFSTDSRVDQILMALCFCSAVCYRLSFRVTCKILLYSHKRKPWLQLFSWYIYSNQVYPWNSCFVIQRFDFHVLQKVSRVSIFVFHAACNSRGMHVVIPSNTWKNHVPNK